MKKICIISMCILIGLLLIYLVLYVSSHSSIVIVTLFSSVLVAFLAFIVSHWAWNLINSPIIKIGFAESSKISGVKQPQSFKICRDSKLGYKDGVSSQCNSNFSTDSTTFVGTVTPFYSAPMPADSAISRGKDCRDTEIYTLEVTNEGRSAARNSILFFRVGEINRICKWNSIPEPSIGGSQHFYDVYHRLTLLQDLPERVAFAFRFTDGSILLTKAV